MSDQPAPKPIYFKKTVDDNADGLPHCDFCNEPTVVASFPASSFIMSVITPDGSFTQDYNDDGWAACSWCELLVEAKDVARLVERYFVIHPLPAGLSPRDRGFMRGLVSTQFALFFEHQTGPGEPVVPPSDSARSGRSG